MAGRENQSRQEGSTLSQACERVHRDDEGDAATSSGEAPRRDGRVAYSGAPSRLAGNRQTRLAAKQGTQHVLARCGGGVLFLPVIDPGAGRAADFVWALHRPESSRRPGEELGEGSADRRAEGADRSALRAHQDQRRRADHRLDHHLGRGLVGRLRRDGQPDQGSQRLLPRGRRPRNGQTTWSGVAAHVRRHRLLRSHHWSHCRDPGAAEAFRPRHRGHRPHSGRAVGPAGGSRRRVAGGALPGRPGPAGPPVPLGQRGRPRRDAALGGRKRRLLLLREHVRQLQQDLRGPGGGCDHVLVAVSHVLRRAARRGDQLGCRAADLRGHDDRRTRAQGGARGDGVGRLPRGTARHPRARRNARTGVALRRFVRQMPAPACRTSDGSTAPGRMRKRRGNTEPDSSVRRDGRSRRGRLRFSQGRSDQPLRQRPAPRQRHT